jgi:hypothetical protein
MNLLHLTFFSISLSRLYAEYFHSVKTYFYEKKFNG